MESLRRFIVTEISNILKSLDPNLTLNFDDIKLEVIDSPNFNDIVQYDLNSKTVFYNSYIIKEFLLNVTIKDPEYYETLGKIIIRYAAAKIVLQELLSKEHLTLNNVLRTLLSGASLRYALRDLLTNPALVNFYLRLGPIARGQVAAVLAIKNELHFRKYLLNLRKERQKLGTYLNSILNINNFEKVLFKIREFELVILPAKLILLMLVQKVENPLLKKELLLLIKSQEEAKYALLKALQDSLSVQLNHFESPDYQFRILKLISQYLSNLDKITDTLAKFEDFIKNKFVNEKDIIKSFKNMILEIILQDKNNAQCLELQYQLKIYWLWQITTYMLYDNDFKEILSKITKYAKNRKKFIEIVEEIVEKDLQHKTKTLEGDVVWLLV
jgi:hypothetical protein